MLRERQKIAMIVAEFFGTGILTITALAVVANLGNAVFVSLGLGLAVAAASMMFGGISGAHCNPAITIALLSARRIQPLAAVVYIAAQLLGGMVAYLLFTYMTTNDIKTNNHFDARLLVSEAVGAFIISLGWAAAVYNRYDTGKTAFVVGASVVLGVLAASFTGTGLVNPAVALGMHTWVWGTFVLGPVLGAVIGFNLYTLLFAPAKTLIAEEMVAEKEMANNGGSASARRPAAGRVMNRRRR